MGHVLGWAGFGIGGLVVSVAIIIIAVQAWSYLFPSIDGSGFVMTLPDGRSYIAIGVRDDINDAEIAVRKHIGEEVSFGPYGEWTVFSKAETAGGKAEEYALSKEKVLALKKANIRKSSFESMAAAIFLGILPGSLIALLGLALRYIFAGPMKRTREL